MKQILHIFAKDVRRFLPEILLVLLPVAALVSIAVVRVTDPQFRSGVIEAGGMMARLIFPLVTFITFAWPLLVFRVIGAERLAGDAQFWITRPYEWKKLFAAKLLFVVTFIYLPVIAGFAIVHAASVTIPCPDVWGSSLFRLRDVLGYITSVVLPAAALATISASLASMMLNIFYGFGSMFAVLLLSLWIRPDNGPGPLSGNICWALTFLICSAVILLQYARRKTRLSFALLIAIPVLICAICVFTPERTPRDRSQTPPGTMSRPL
jgi:hypothetical protein